MNICEKNDSLQKMKLSISKTTSYLNSNFQKIHLPKNLKSFLNFHLKIWKLFCISTTFVVGQKQKSLEEEYFLMNLIKIFNPNLFLTSTLSEKSLISLEKHEALTSSQPGVKDT